MYVILTAILLFFAGLHFTGAATNGRTIQVSLFWFLLSFLCNFFSGTSLTVPLLLFFIGFAGADTNGRIKGRLKSFFSFFFGFFFILTVSLLLFFIDLQEWVQLVDLRLVFSFFFRFFFVFFFLLTVSLLLSLQDGIRWLIGFVKIGEVFFFQDFTKLDSIKYVLHHHL